MNDEEKIRKLKAKNIGEINIDNDRLILFTVNMLEEIKIEPTFDKIVVTAFKLFPERFSLTGFPEYPDGKRIHDCLFHCTYKPKNWLFGNAQSGYRISERGKYFLEETNKMLDGEIKINKKYSAVVRRKELTFINLLKNTSAYKKYSEKNAKNISRDEIKEVLRVDTLSKEELVKNNLNRYIDYAKKIGDKTVENFLNFIKDYLRI